ncbi:MAG: DUF6048 family protein [Flammeovirgaceae bacterium]|nr:DUF6048 family protein [Flammeovirgaceae bacterium]
MRLGTDLISIIWSRTGDSFKGYEFSGDVDFNHYYLTADFGKWERVFAPENGRYSNDGNYWRVGIDYNFLKKDPERNMFFFGLRYANGKFSENFTYTFDDPLWGSSNQTLTNADVKAKWMELTTGLRVKIWKVIWMGYTARYKFGLSTKGEGSLIPHDVPGYGRTDKDFYWGFNYMILVKIPVRG